MRKMVYKDPLLLYNYSMAELGQDDSTGQQETQG